MEWMETAVLFLSEAFQNLQLLFDPEAFVVGGHLPAPILAFICERCGIIAREAQTPGGTNAPGIFQGSLQDEAAAIGAAALPTHELIAPDYEGITCGGQLSLLDPIGA
jgi:predicted NBD/HSP70 family sugar kinase